MWQNNPYTQQQIPSYQWLQKPQANENSMSPPKSSSTQMQSGGDSGAESAQQAKQPQEYPNPYQLVLHQIRQLSYTMSSQFGIGHSFADESAAAISQQLQAYMVSLFILLGYYQQIAASLTQAGHSLDQLWNYVPVSGLPLAPANVQDPGLAARQALATDDLTARVQIQQQHITALMQQQNVANMAALQMHQAAQLRLGVASHAQPHTVSDKPAQQHHKHETMSLPQHDHYGLHGLHESQSYATALQSAPMTTPVRAPSCSQYVADNDAIHQVFGDSAKSLQRVCDDDVAEWMVHGDGYGGGVQDHEYAMSQYDYADEGGGLWGVDALATPLDKIVPHEQLRDHVQETNAKALTSPVHNAAAEAPGRTGGDRGVVPGSKAADCLEGQSRPNSGGESAEHVSVPPVGGPRADDEHTGECGSGSTPPVQSSNTNASPAQSTVEMSVPSQPAQPTVEKSSPPTLPVAGSQTRAATSKRERSPSKCVDEAAGHARNITSPPEKKQRDSVEEEHVQGGVGAQPPPSTPEQPAVGGAAPDAAGKGPARVVGRTQPVCGPVLQRPKCIVKSKVDVSAVDKPVVGSVDVAAKCGSVEVQGTKGVEVDTVGEGCVCMDGVKGGVRVGVAGVVERGRRVGGARPVAPLVYRGGVVKSGVEGGRGGGAGEVGGLEDDGGVECKVPGGGEVVEEGGKSVGVQGVSELGGGGCSIVDVMLQTCQNLLKVTQTDSGSGDSPSQSQSPEQATYASHDSVGTTIETPQSQQANELVHEPLQPQARAARVTKPATHPPATYSLRSRPSTATNPITQPITQYRHVSKTLPAPGVLSTVASKLPKATSSEVCNVSNVASTSAHGRSVQRQSMDDMSSTGVQYMQHDSLQYMQHNTLQYNLQTHS